MYIGVAIGLIFVGVLVKALLNVLMKIKEEDQQKVKNNYFNKLYDLQKMKEKNIITEEEFKKEKEKKELEEKRQEERKEDKMAIIKAIIFFGLFTLLLVLGFIMFE